MTLEALQLTPEFILCLLRVAAVVGSIPVFSGAQAPKRVRAGLSLILAILIFPQVQTNISLEQASALHLVMIGGYEIILGLLLGFVGQLLFVAAQFGGTIIGYQMGFAAANIVDPQSQQQIQLLSQFQSVVAMLVFLAVDGHHIFFRAMVKSFDLVPPGTVGQAEQAVPFIVELTSQMFVLGMQLSAPILVVLLLSDFILGIMSRVFPQLNAFMLKFPINIGMSFILIGLTAELVVSLLQEEFLAVGRDLLSILTLVEGQ
ncbi:MAG: flagellar biosynthetic protein FliR [Desulfovermiculus sp.]